MAKAFVMEPKNAFLLLEYDKLEGIAMELTTKILQKVQRWNIAGFYFVLKKSFITLLEKK